MSDSIFCPNCGMLKKNCVCGKYVAERTKKPYQKKEKKSKGTYFSKSNKSKSSSSINKPKGLYQYENRNPVTVSEDLDVPNAEIYDIAEESEKVVGFEFVWFTDGMGWISARNNLKETFDKMDNVYNIADMKNGIMKKIFV